PRHDRAPLTKGATMSRSLQPLHLVLATAALAFALAGCCCQATPLPADKADYAGHWTSPDMAVRTTPEGYLNYERHRGASKTSVNGPIQSLTDSAIEVGVGPITTTFTVDAPPKQSDEGVWTMTIDGVELERQ